VPSELVVSPDNEHDVLAVDDALTELSKLDPRQALIVELRFFGGMTAEEVAHYLGVSKPTVDRQWRVARAWLRKQFSEE
jgi:RNA polymerase sigma factor (sigma-70 family)